MLDNLETTEDITLGIGKSLALFRDDVLGEVVLCDLNVACRSSSARHSLAQKMPQLQS